MTQNKDRYLVKFIFVSTLSFFIGTVHGVLQLIPPIRHWLDSIGSPYGGPGHMIDPLAHAHINLIGGVTILAMATTYYLLPRITDVSLYSKKMADYSFWLASLGVAGFYSTLMIFGAWEGMLLLADDAAGQAALHSYYVIIISVVSTVMGIGLWLYLLNVALTLKKLRKA